MGKESDVQAPDPRLTEAQIQSLAVQNNALQRIVDNANELQPLQREQMQFAMDSNRQAYADAQEDRQFMLSRRGALRGIQDRMVRDANAFSAEDRAQQYLGQTYGDINQAFDNTRQQAVRSMTRMGVNPNDGRMAAFQNQNSATQALAMATASHKVREAARQEGYQLTDRANNALAGYPAMGMQALGMQAGYGAAGMGLANQGLAGLNSGYGQVVGGAGAMGSNATSAYGAQAGAYNQSQANSGQEAGAAIGAVGTIAAVVI